MVHYIHAIFPRDGGGKICRKCGHRNPGDYRFCENCGAVFPETEEVPEEEQEISDGNGEEATAFILDAGDTGCSEAEEAADVKQGNGRGDEEATAFISYADDADLGDKTVLEGAVAGDRNDEADDGQGSDETVSGVQENDPAAPEGKASRKKWIIGIAIGILVVAAAVIVLLMYLNRQDMAEHNARIDKADRYMDELDYEKAEAAYLDAIEIDPAEPDAYVKVADIYEAQGRYQEAEEILKKGERKAGGRAIEKKLEQIRPYSVYDDYLENVLTPEIGLADVDEELTYDTLTPGLLSALVEDFDGDGIPNLLTVEYGEDESTALTFSLYTCENEEAELLDEMECDYESIEGCFDLQSDVFLKQYEDNYYIVIGYENSDSSTTSLVMTEIYEISDEIKRETELEYFQETNTEFTITTRYCVDDTTEAEFDYDEYDYDYERDYDEVDKIIESTDTKGISAFEDAISDYGFAREKIADEGKWCKRIEYDEDNVSEIPLCYIRHGESTEDEFIDYEYMDHDVWDYFGTGRYLFDYTDLHERVSQ